MEAKANRGAAGSSLMENGESPWTIVVRWVVLALALTGIAEAWALDPHKSLTQYVHDSWSTEDGLPSSGLVTLAQTRDGYLWIGSDAGLVRFDGARFDVFDSENTAAFRNNLIRCLYQDDDGHLWIGTDAGLIRYDGESFVRHGVDVTPGMTSDHVRSITQDSHGALYFGTRGGGLMRMRDGEFNSWGIDDGLPSDHVSALLEDRQGRLWVGYNDAGLALLQEERWTVVGADRGLAGVRVRDLLEDHEGQIWVATDEGLFRHAGGEWTAFTTAAGMSQDHVRAIEEDRHGNIWLAMATRGICRYDLQTFACYSTEEGLPHDAATGVLEDQEHNVWFTTRGGGLVRLKDGPFTPYGLEEGLSGELVLSLLEDRRGTLWLGTYTGGLSWLRDGRIGALEDDVGLSAAPVMTLVEDDGGDLWIGSGGQGVFRLRPGEGVERVEDLDLPAAEVSAILRDRYGNLWIGTMGFGLARVREGETVVYTEDDGLPGDLVSMLHEDRHGDLWIGSFGGGLARMTPGDPPRFSSIEEIAGDTVLSIIEDEDGTFWLGTYGEGLLRYRDGQMVRYTTREGLPDSSVWQILDDGQGTLWMSSNRGIYQLSRQQLDDLAGGSRETLEPTVYGKGDGMRTAECVGGGQPAGVRTRDGRLWFATTAGVAAIDPNHIEINERVPPVYVQRFLVDDEDLPLGGIDDGVPEFDSGVTRFEIHYTALSLVSPERVRFRHRLEGLDEDWIDAETRRVAYYTSLPPGDYRFRVIACNNDGVWNEQEATLTFRIRPRYFQTLWFYSLCGAALLLLGGGGNSLRSRRMRARQQELERLIALRTAELAETNARLEQANRELEQLATSDALTGLANRRLFNERLATEWRRSARNRTPLSVILLDVDHFKAFNDTYGHQEGDQCLRRIAAVMRASAQRASDLPARYGGEEFVVVLPETPLEGASEFAEAMRLRVLALEIPHESSRTAKWVTVSQGVASVVPSLDQTPADLVAAADAAMYRAKQGGRDRVVRA